MSEAVPLLEVPADAVLRRHGDRWLFSNLLLRSHVEVSPEAIPWLVRSGQPGSGPVPEELWARDWTERSVGRGGLHSDPSGLATDPGEPYHGQEAVDLLRLRRILVDAHSGERDELLRPLVNLLDRSSLGSFHQRVAQTNLLHSRTNSEWVPWHDQKFSTDGKELLPGPYRDIQFPFVRDRLAPLCQGGCRVIDFGCGNGFFSGLMAGHGASVLGIDSSDELLRVARANHAQCEFRHVDDLVGAVREVASIPPGTVDLIFLQDTYLLLRDGSGAMPSDLTSLLGAFHGVLAPGGRLVLDEPDPDYWLALRLGDREHPIAVLSDAGRGVFEVAPHLHQIVADLNSVGLAMTACDPILASAEYPFEHTFPVWRWLEFVPLPAGSEGNRSGQ